MQVDELVRHIFECQQLNKWPLATHELPCFAFECVALVSNRSECVQQLLAKSVATTSSCHTELELALALALSQRTNTASTQVHRELQRMSACHTQRALRAAVPCNSAIDVAFMHSSLPILLQPIQVKLHETNHHGHSWIFYMVATKVFSSFATKVHSPSLGDIL